MTTKADIYALLTAYDRPEVTGPGTVRLVSVEEYLRAKSPTRPEPGDPTLRLRPQETTDGGW